MGRAPVTAPFVVSGRRRTLAAPSPGEHVMRRFFPLAVPVLLCLTPAAPKANADRDLTAPKKVVS